VHLLKFKKQADNIEQHPSHPFSDNDQHLTQPKNIQRASLLILQHLFFSSSLFISSTASGAFNTTSSAGEFSKGTGFILYIYIYIFI
jgi:hypothetical protein